MEIGGFRHAEVVHLVYASSSSVYGGNRKLPFAAEDSVDHPVSFYAATKKANEVMAHSYAHLYGLACTGLRFFTVYGPWGRPDMAYWKFSEAILDGRPIDVYNYGQMSRDFTYIDDVREAVRVLISLPPVERSAEAVPQPVPSTGWAPPGIYNIGNDRPDTLLDMIDILETVLGRKAEKRMLPMQPGDVPAPWADIGPLSALTGYRPATELREGLERFADWYRWWRNADDGILYLDAAKGAPRQ